ALQGPWRRRDSHRRTPGPHGVLVRRRRTGEGRLRDPLPRRCSGWAGARRGHKADDVLGRRDDRRRNRLGNAGERRLRASGQQVQRPRPMGPDRPGRRRRGRGPPDHARGALPGRHGPSVSRAADSMAWIPGGTFLMGSDDWYPEESPVHAVAVDGFWIDRHPVTVAEFATFIEATGYVTVAERPLDPALFPLADPEDLVPGALVFQATSGP